GEGELAEVVGSKALPSDEFEDSLGLQHTARADWQALAPNGPGHLALTSYAQGVNALIEQEEQNNTLPVMFTWLNYKPRPWTPVDTLVIQEDMIQTLAFDNIPLDYALFAKSLGYDRTMQWFPIIAPNTQHPYDTGPFQPASITPLPAQTSMVQDNNAAI